MTEFYKIPYTLFIRIHSPKPKDCGIYYDKYHDREFELCYKDLFVRVSDDIFIPRAFFMYKLDREYRLRKSHSYYHKETPFHSYNDATLFKILKFLKSKRVKFEYWFEFPNENPGVLDSWIKGEAPRVSRELASITLGYWDYLLENICGGTNIGEYKNIDSKLYRVGELLAMNNTIVKSYFNKSIEVREYLFSEDCENFELVNRVPKHSIGKVVSEMNSLIIFPTNVRVIKKDLLTGVIVTGVGNSGDNYYLYDNKRRVRLDYSFGVGVIGLLLRGKNVLLPEKPHIVKDIIRGKYWKSIIYLVDVNSGRLYYWDKSNDTIHSFPGNVFNVVKPDRAFKEYNPLRLEVIMAQKIITVKGFNYPSLSFKEMVKESENTIQENANKQSITWSESEVLEYLKEECKRLMRF